MLAIKQTLVQTCGDQALKSSKIYDQHSGPLSETERFFYGARNEVRGHGTATCADVVWAVSLQIQAVGETGVLHFNRPCKTKHKSLIYIWGRWNIQQAVGVVVFPDPGALCVNIWDGV